MSDMEIGKRESSIRKLWKSPAIRQVYSSIAALLPALSSGCTFGYTSILIPQLQEPDTTIPVNASSISWIASIIILSIMIFPFVSGYSQERCGRKKTHYTMCLLNTVGWITIAFSNSVEALLCGRFLIGAGTGIGATLSPVYIAETTSPQTRHVYLACFPTLLVFGELLVHLLGTYLKWKTVAWVCVSFPILSGLIMLKLPKDTPNWYISKGQLENAERTFKWYRGSGDDAKNEFRKMVRSAQEPKQSISFVSNVRKREFWKPLIILTCYFILLPISCDNLMAFYSIQIMKDILGNNFDAYAVMIIVDSLRLSAVMFSCFFFMKYCRRRTATMASGVLVCISLAAIALFMYLQKHEIIPKTYYSISLAFLVIHTLSLPLGISVLPWILLGELFPANLKWLGTTIVLFINSVFLFIVAKTAPYLFESIGVSPTFAFYALLVFILTIVITILLPETKGKTLQEIEEYFSSNRKEIDNKGKYHLQNEQEL